MAYADTGKTWANPGHVVIKEATGKGLSSNLRREHTYVNYFNYLILKVAVGGRERQSASLVVDGYGCKSEFVFSQPKVRVGVMESRPSESYQGLLIKGLTIRSMPFCSYL